MAIDLQYYGDSHPNLSAILDRIGGIWEIKADYDKAYRDLTAEYVAPYVAKRNQLDTMRFPDLFGANAPQSTGGSRSTVIQYDNKGNPIR
jgi:hypothetical protein